MDVAVNNITTTITIPQVDFNLLKELAKKFGWVIQTENKSGIEEALDRGDVEAAKTIARDTRGPIASIAYQGLMRIDQGIDVVEKSIVSYGGVQGGLLEKNLSWITLFIAMAPSLGFLGTVVGMIRSFAALASGGGGDSLQLSEGISEALVNTASGILTSWFAVVSYNYYSNKIDKLTYALDEVGYTIAQTYEANHADEA